MLGVVEVYADQDSWGARERWSRRKDPTFELELNGLTLSLRQNFALLGEAVRTATSGVHSADASAPPGQHWSGYLGCSGGAGQVLGEMVT